MNHVKRLILCLQKLPPPHPFDFDLCDGESWHPISVGVCNILNTCVRKGDEGEARILQEAWLQTSS
jgi:hypothetical protein